MIYIHMYSIDKQYCDTFEQILIHTNMHRHIYNYVVKITYLKSNKLI